jgi:hypothetical protein
LSWPRATPATQASGEKLNVILEVIDKKTDQYAKSRSFLSDPDQAKRMAAFSAMTDSGIPALQEMALDHALSSDDIAMQLAALRVLLTNTKALTFQLKLSDDNSERTRQSVASHGGGFSIQIDDWDTETASFSKAGDTYVGASSGRGQVNGRSFHYKSRMCRVFAVLEETGGTMRGELSCSGFAEPVNVSLAIR